MSRMIAADTDHCVVCVRRPNPPARREYGWAGLAARGLDAGDNFAKTSQDTYIFYNAYGRLVPDS
jgi:hypothetical protein